MANKSQDYSSMPEDLTFQKLEEATKRFSDEYKVGSGGYGEVYKGVLDNGIEIAVKKLYYRPGIVEVQFKKEFDSLMRVHHPNIIQLVGYCYETREKYIKIETGEYVWAKREERALCFEYLERGSLDKILSDESSGLHWHTRYQIIKGICEGLNYLHNAYENPIYHLDLKPENILLDENMIPKIADFGLSRLFASTETYMTQNEIKGTFGYMPPEYIKQRQISKKFDVFSLGRVIIEIMAGRLGYATSGQMPPQQFTDLVQENWTKRLKATASFKYHDVTDSLEEVKTCIEIALTCVEADRNKRPTIREIMDKLKEIETRRMSGTSKSYECELQGLIVDPLELRFPFELNREASSILQLTNKSNEFIVFRAKTNQSTKYSTRPDKGILPPWSKQYIVARMEAQEHGPPDMVCNDMFLVQSTSASEGLKTGDIHDDFFEKVAAAGKVVMDEVKLPIVYVGLPEAN